ncbi:DUF2207 domain-containing protein [Oerskovia sp. M15]
MVDERADPHDVTATIVDLAVRGHLRIVEVEAPSKRGKGGDWRLDRIAGHEEELLGFERTLLDKIFASRGDVKLSDLKTTFAASMAQVQSELYEEVTRRGWFRANPQSVRSHWYLAGGALLVVGVGLAIGLGVLFGPTWALVAVPLPVLGVLAFVLASRAPARTAEGTAVLAQTLGFRRYLETAEAGQLRFEEGEDIFSRYLPYAIVFGVADRWAASSPASRPRADRRRAHLVRRAGVRARDVLGRVLVVRVLAQRVLGRCHDVDLGRDAQLVGGSGSRAVEASRVAEAVAAGASAAGERVGCGPGTRARLRVA